MGPCDGQGDLSNPSPKQKLVAAEPACGCAVTRAASSQCRATLCRLHQEKASWTQARVCLGLCRGSPCRPHGAGAAIGVPESFLPWERLQPGRLQRGADFP